MNDPKKVYESAEIEITPISKNDVITTSGSFNGRDDLLAGWF